MVLRNDKGFADRLQVLLVAYFNLGISQVKKGEAKYAKLIFEQGFKMSKKYLGEDHYFAQRFNRRLLKPNSSSGGSFVQNLQQETA